MENPGSYSSRLYLRSDRRKPIYLGTGIDYERSQRGGREWEAEVEATIRPTPNWELEVSPNFSWERNAAQYVTRTDAVPFAPTYGSRYVFSDLERRSFSLETRLNVAFSPDLTLQLYAQPLLSSGDYLNYKQLLRASSFDFDVLDEGTRSFIDPADGYRYLDFDGDGMPDINFSDRDFNIQSLRMNVVLRWEYRPGSRVFLVWQQTRSERDENGTLDIGRDFGNLFGVESENIFIVKFNYWFGV